MFWSNSCANIDIHVVDAKESLRRRPRCAFFFTFTLGRCHTLRNMHYASSAIPGGTVNVCVFFRVWLASLSLNVAAIAVLSCCRVAVRTTVRCCAPIASQVVALDMPLLMLGGGGYCPT